MFLLIYFNSCFRHRSKHKSNARIATESQKYASKTMGPAKVDTRAPNDFLKKHEMEPKPGESKYFNELVLYLSKLIYTTIIVVDLLKDLMPVCSWVKLHSRPP